MDAAKGPPAAGASEATPMEGVESTGDGQRSFPPLKVELYKLLVRQLQDDGLTKEAQSLSERLHIEPNTLVEKDALLEAYGKSLKYAFGNQPEEQWTPVGCNPVPAIGAQEKFLDLDAPVGGAAAGNAAGPSESGPEKKKPPEIRLLYTASHKMACRSVTYSPDGRQCATGCLDGSIKILDCAKMRVVSTATDGPLGKMRVTEEELSKPITRTLQDHVGAITCLAFHPTNPTLFSGSVDKAVKIFDLTRPVGHKKAFSVLQDVHPVRSICIHPCGDFLLVGTSHQAVRLYDLQTLNCFTTFNQDDHHSSGVNDVRCTSDGRVFASASSDGVIQLWDAVSHKVVNRLAKAHSGASVATVRWSRGLQYLLSSGSDGRCRLWDVRTGKEMFCMGFGPRSCDYSNAVFCAGERYVASSNSNTRLGDVSLFDAQTGSPIYMKLGLHNLPVHALEASPVDGTVITGCDDDKARYFAVEDKA